MWLNLFTQRWNEKTGVIKGMAARAVLIAAFVAVIGIVVIWDYLSM